MPEFVLFDQSDVLVMANFSVFVDYDRSKKRTSFFLMKVVFSIKH